MDHFDFEHVVQEHEFENLASFNTKRNQGLTSWDNGMGILEQHQVVCTMKLWYQQKYLWAILRKGGVLMVLPQKLSTIITTRT